MLDSNFDYLIGSMTSIEEDVDLNRLTLPCLTGPLLIFDLNRGIPWSEQIIIQH